MPDRPLYVRIRDDLKVQVERGDWPPDHQIPSEAELAQQYGVTRMTVRQALEQLAHAGLLVRRRGVGTFVARPSKTHRTLNRLASFAEELGVEAESVGTSIYAQELADAPADVAEFLPIKAGEKVARLLRLRTVDSRPVSLQESWLRLVTLPSVLREPLITGSLYRTLRERAEVAVVWAQQEVTAVAASPEQAAILNVTPGSPLINATRRTFADNDAPIELAHSWTRVEFPILLQLAVHNPLR